MNPELFIRRATDGDAGAICRIYNSYVLTSTVTFESVEVDADAMTRRINEKLATHDWLVGEVDGNLVAYAYYGSFRPRAAYGHTVESTIYVAEERKGHGFGKRLYSDLLASAMQKGFREVIGVIALPNSASTRLHQAIGFHEIGILRSVGHKFGGYIDVSLWQKSLNSPLA